MVNMKDRCIGMASEWIGSSDALLIGASNGLSIAEGYHIFANNDMFRSQFADFQSRYRIMNVIQGCMYPFPTVEARKEFYDRLIRYWITGYTPTRVMRDLRTIVGDKPYFIVTSNGDTHLELSGFASEKVFEIEGTFLTAFGMVDDKSQQLSDFVTRYSDKRLVVLELGVGRRNTLIKLPLMQLVARLPQSRYITLNLDDELYIPDMIADRSIGLAGDIGETLQML